MSRLRDWWRGYSERDFDSLRRKMNLALHGTPGNSVYLTGAETRAMRAEVPAHVMEAFLCCVSITATRH